MTKESPRYLRAGVVAKMFGVTPRTVVTWGEQGLIEVIILPSGQRRFERDSVEAFAKTLTKEVPHD